MVFNDEFQKFISVWLFKVESRSTGVRVVNGGESKRDANGPKPGKLRHSHVGAK